MLRHPEEKKFYAYALGISLCFHAVTFSAIENGIHLPGWARIKPPVPQSQQVTFELVDEHDRLEPRFKKPVDSNLIDERSQESKDRVKGKTPGALPKLDGEAKLKTVKQIPPKTEAVKPQEKVLAKQAEKEPIREPSLKKEETTIKEIRKKIKELAELEKQLPEPKPVKPIEPQTQEEQRQAVVARPSSERERRLLKNLVSEAQEVGDLSLATREDVLAPYLKRMREKVYEKWYPFVSLKFVDLNPSKVIVKYRILPDGSVDGVEITYSEGSVVFKDYCAAAVRSAAPFDPLPIDLPEYLRKRYLTISFTFYYG